MTTRVVQVTAVLWAALAAAIALPAIGDTSGTARVVVTAASIGFPLCAIAAVFALGANKRKTAGLLLAASAATPLYFAQVFGLIPLVVGVSLLSSHAGGFSNTT